MPHVLVVDVLTLLDNWVLTGQSEVANRPLNYHLIFIHKDRVTLNRFERIKGPIREALAAAGLL